MSLKTELKAKQLRKDFYDKGIENSFGVKKANEEAQHYALICLEKQLELLAEISSKKSWGKYNKLMDIRKELLNL